MKDKPVQLGKDYDLMINGTSHYGEGIGRINNFAVFVPGAIVEEKVRAKITEVKQNFARAELEKVILPSPYRTEPLCSFYHLCGGCHLQHISYTKQLEIKRLIVQDALIKLGNLKAEVLPPIGMKYPWRYRNKGYFQVGQEREKLRLGFYRTGSHDFVPANKCVLFSTQINELTQYLEEQLDLQKARVYNRTTGEGNLRNILIRESRSTGEIMLVFITSEDRLGFDQDIVNNIIKVCPRVVSIYQNINKSTKSVLLGKDFKLLKGNPELEDSIGPFKFKISPQSFFQVNVLQTQVLIEKISEHAKLKGEEVIIDSYCGIGTIAIYLANQVKKAYGIEMEERAIGDARVNCKLNHIFNLKFFTGKAEEWLYRWRKKGEEIQVIILDPPRKGCSKEVLKEILKIKPKKILYISCNPATLARDLSFLTKDGYKLEMVLPVDMFPQTNHIECVTSLSI